MPDVRFAVEVWLVVKELEGAALFGKVSKREIGIECFHNDSHPLLCRDAAPSDFTGNLSGFDVLKNIPHGEHSKPLLDSSYSTMRAFVQAAV